MFEPQDRLIYSYQDGTLDTEGQPVTVYVDPAELQGGMSAALNGDVNGVVERSYVFNPETGKGSPPEIAEQNALRHAAAVRQVFGLPPVDRFTGKGATRAMCVRLWNHFCEFLDEKKNQPDSSVTLPADTAPESSPTRSMGESDIRCTSVFG